MTSLLSAEGTILALDIPHGTKRLLIAYSGGLDSHVLLHLVNKYCRHNMPSSELIAVHVNHGLNPNAAKWAQHCESICQKLGISYNLVELDARAPTGESQEAWARKLRYEALEQFTGPGDILMTAHHQDDMAETVLIQLFRGSGPAGLAAMPVKTAFGQGYHYRPLLQFTRADLKVYAEQQHLVWIEDDSNADQRYDRNLLRNSILPAISQRWPAISRTLYRAARIQADAAALLNEFGSIDIQLCGVSQGKYLSVSKLLGLNNVRAANMLRCWIRSRGFPLPTERQLSETFTSVLTAGPDTNPCVSWSGAELRRYRDTIFIIAPLPESPDPELCIDWAMHTPCKLTFGSLRASRGMGEGLKADLCKNDRIEVRFRSAENLIRTAGHHRQIRKLFQEQGIAPCYRNYVPMLFVENTLAAIPGVCIADDYLAKADEAAWRIHWTESEMACPGSQRSQ